jgi:quercetin dioxygenase-like cupin family protein
VPALDRRQGESVQKTSLEALGRQLRRAAGGSDSGWAADTVHGGHEKALRQTVVALVAGRVLAEHENPGEASVLVLDGRVRMVAGEDSWEGRQGDLIIVPPTRHRLEAMTDATVLLTVVKR